jgi:FkbM family methyltransferase
MIPVLRPSMTEREIQAVADVMRSGWHRETTFLESNPPADGDAIVVIGAYSGTIAGMLIKAWPQAQHYLIEPQDWACQQLRAKFGMLPNVHVCEYGLGDRSGTFKQALYTSYDCTFLRSDSKTFVDDPAIYFDAQMVEFGQWMEHKALNRIHYASINIEGFEYVLLPHLFETGQIKKIHFLGVSWHDARFNCPVPGPYRWQGQLVDTLEQTRGMLAKTHRLILDIDNWQTWMRNER